MLCISANAYLEQLIHVTVCPFGFFRHGLNHTKKNSDTS